MKSLVLTILMGGLSVVLVHWFQSSVKAGLENNSPRVYSALVQSSGLNMGKLKDEPSIRFGFFKKTAVSFVMSKGIEKKFSTYVGCNDTRVSLKSSGSLADENNPVSIKWLERLAESLGPSDGRQNLILIPSSQPELDIKFDYSSDSFSVASGHSAIFDMRSSVAFGSVAFKQGSNIRDRQEFLLMNVDMDSEYFSGIDQGEKRVLLPDIAHDGGIGVYRVSLYQRGEGRNCKHEIAYYTKSSESAETIANSLTQPESFWDTTFARPSGRNRWEFESLHLPDRNFQFHEQGKEDEELFKKAVGLGVIRHDSGTGAIEVSPLSQASNTLLNKHLQFLKPIPPVKSFAESSIIQALHFKPAGKAVRREVRKFNERTYTTALIVSQSKGQQETGFKHQIKAFACRSVNVCEVELPIEVLEPGNRQIPRKLLEQAIYEGLSGSAAYVAPNLSKLSFRPKFIKYSLSNASDFKDDVFVVSAGGKTAAQNFNHFIAVRGSDRKLYKGQLSKLSKNGDTVEIVAPVLLCSGDCSIYSNNDHLSIETYSKGDGSQSLIWKPRRDKNRTARRSIGATQDDVCVQAGRSRKSIYDRNGELLYNGVTDSLQPKAKSLGLSNLIGADNSYIHHLTGLVGCLKDDLEISIDIKVQEVVRDAVEKFVDKKGYLTGNELHNRMWKTGRGEATVVIMDTSTGEILASASSSSDDSVNLNGDLRWVIEQGTRPDRSPFRWQAVFHNSLAEDQPGSTAKLLSMLAMVKQVYGPELILANDYKETIKKMLNGMSSDDLEATFRASNFAYRPSCEALVETYPYAQTEDEFHYLGKDRVTSSYTETCADRTNIGLVDALSESDNAWFAAMLDFVSPVTLFTGGSNEQGALFGLRGMDNEIKDLLYPTQSVLNGLGISQDVNLLAGANVNSTLPEKVYSSWVLPESKLKVGEIHTRYNYNQLYGYKYSLGPVHLATVSSSIQQGKVVLPTLVSNLNEEQRKKNMADHFKDEPLFSKANDSLNSALRYFSSDETSLLHRALSKAASKTGTASRIGENLYSRVWAKTGTMLFDNGKQRGQRGREEYGNASLTGWFCAKGRDSESGGNCSDELVRYAFSCSVKYVDREGERMEGSGVCAELMKNVITNGDRGGVW